MRDPVVRAASNRRYDKSAKGRARNASGNAKRIFAGRTYLGTENQYPAPREAVARFARELIEQHRKELHGTHA